MIFTFYFGFVFGQAKYQDVIYFKDGEVERGIILETTPNKSIKLKNLDDNIFVYKLDEIKEIKRDSLFGNEEAKEKDGSVNYYSCFSTNYGVSNGFYGSRFLGINLSNGIRLDSVFIIGLNIGCKLTKMHPYYPVFFDFGYKPKKNRRFSPFFIFGVGYLFDEGLLINQNLGLLIKLNKKFDLNVGFGYESHKLRYIEGYSSGISINVGISY